MIPFSAPFSQWSHHRTASARHSMAGPGTALCGKVWFHGPIMIFTGAGAAASIRGTESRYPSYQPPIRNAGTVSRP